MHELIYFNGAGRAEAIRIMLHAAGIDFKDTRFAGKDWPEIKPTTPLGFVPVLKIDGVPYCQSGALLRYAGKLAGVYPEDPLEALMVDQVMDTAQELATHLPRGSNEEEKKKLREEFQATTMTKFAKFFESLIQKNGGVGFVKSGFSLADVQLMGLVKLIQSGSMDYLNVAFFDDYPGIIATVKAAEENEKVVAYYKSVQA